MITNEQFNKAMEIMFHQAVAYGLELATKPPCTPIQAYTKAIAEIKATVFSESEVQGMYECGFKHPHPAGQQCDCDHE